MAAAFRVLVVLLSLVGLGFSLTCYSSNGQSQKATDNGMEKSCRATAFTNRYCIKFKTDGRPNKVFRNCDHIYEKFFGYDVLDVKGEGCWEFETVMNEKEEKGIYCACEGDRCNGGSIAEADLTPVDNNEVSR